MLPGRGERWQRDPRAGAMVIVAGVAFAGFIAFLAAIMLAPGFVRFDMAATSAIRAIDLPGLRQVALYVTRVADVWPMAALTGATALLLLMRGRRTSAVTLALSVLLGSAAGAALKMLFVMVRPALDVAQVPIPEAYSFPSGHALASLLYFGSVGFLALLHHKDLRRAAVVVGLCIVAAMSIALSRVYLGAHYLGDVVGTWLLGSGMLALTVVISARWGASSADGDATVRAAAGR